jgi:hypothetical protein
MGASLPKGSESFLETSFLYFPVCYPKLTSPINVHQPRFNHAVIKLQVRPFLTPSHFVIWKWLSHNRLPPEIEIITIIWYR